MARVPTYISTIISAAADEGPDEMMCFPCRSTLFINFPNKNVQNITEIDMSLRELFRERMSLYRHICNSYTMGCPPVRGDNPRALASGLSYVQVDKHGITILYHLHQCRPCTSRDISC